MTTFMWKVISWKSTENYHATAAPLWALNAPLVSTLAHHSLLLHCFLSLSYVVLPLYRVFLTRCFLNFVLHSSPLSYPLSVGEILCCDINNGGCPFLLRSFHRQPNRGMSALHHLTMSWFCRMSFLDVCIVQVMILLSSVVAQTRWTNCISKPLCKFKKHKCINYNKNTNAKATATTTEVVLWLLDFCFLLMCHCFVFSWKFAKRRCAVCLTRWATMVCSVFTNNQIAYYS